MDKQINVINEQDINNARYVDAGELLPCPFCGTKPISYGVRNEETSNVVYKISCPNMACNANTFACMGTDAEYSRRAAVVRWNRRIKAQYDDPIKPKKK